MKNMQTVAGAAAVLGVSVLVGTVPPTSDLANGAWAGTMRDGTTQTYFTVAFPNAAAADDPQGDLYFPKRSEVGYPLDSVVRDGREVTFAATVRGRTLRFSGLVDGGSMSGSVVEGGRKQSFTLQHLERWPEATLEQYVGDYVAGDRTVGIARPYTYVMFLDWKTGRMGFLWPLGKDSFFTGPSKGIHYPAEGTFSFERDRGGHVTALTMRLRGETHFRGIRKSAGISRPLDVHNGGALISGTLWLPNGPAPHPAVMLLAGSNYQTRVAQNAFLWWVRSIFLKAGFAVYAYDKRGAGFSTGDRDDGFVVSDAVAGFRALTAQADVNRSCVGILGESQGGMAAPKVAATVPGVAFIANTSGATVNANLQEIQRTAREMRADGFSEQDVRDATELQTLKFAYAMTGQGWSSYAADINRFKNRAWFPDPYVGPPTEPNDPAFAFWRKGGGDAPTDYWAQFTGPALYIDGQNETNQDPQSNFAAFENAMHKAKNDRFSTVVVKGADHSMLVDPRGGNTIDRLLTNYQMKYFDDLASWIHTLPANCQSE